MLLDDYNRTILGSLKRVSEWLVSGFYLSRHARAISQNEECSECSPISVSVNGSNHWRRVSKRIAVIVGTCPKKWASPRDMIRDRSRSGMLTVTGNRPSKRSASPTKISAVLQSLPIIRRSSKVVDKSLISLWFVVYPIYIIVDIIYISWFIPLIYSFQKLGHNFSS